MNESTLVPRKDESDLDWLARNVHVWKYGYDLAVVQRGGGEIYVTWPSACSCGITKKQWLARRSELQNKPSWNDAPEWANWLAQDSANDDTTGAWWWYEIEPSSCKRTWSIRGDAQPSSSIGEVIGDWRGALEKRPDENAMPSSENQVRSSEDAPDVSKFEPFVSVEDANPKFPRDVDYVGKINAAITASKYTKTINGAQVDVYDILKAWNVVNPALQHLIKKALQCGQRGHKDNAQDLQDIIDSAIRAKELES